jgi:hypothetical protein
MAAMSGDRQDAVSLHFSAERWTWLSGSSAGVRFDPKLSWQLLCLERSLIAVDSVQLARDGPL